MCKNTVSIVKYANLWGFCCLRRRGCLSSLVLKRIRVSVVGKCFSVAPVLQIRKTYRGKVQPIDS